MMKFSMLVSAPLLFCTPLAYAQSSTAAESSGADPINTVVVIGQGETRQAQTMSSADMALEVAGTSPIKLIASLPGVNYTATDPFGAYEWATDINIRGFQKNQLGYTLDGVPLGDMSYGNWNGLHISRAVISENMDSATLAQGAGLVSTASSSNLGGTLEFFSHRPSDKMGGTAELTGGSDGFLRGFARVETGLIAGLGGKAYLAYANSDGDKWKGVGKHKYQQANFGFEQPLPLGKLSGYYDWSQRRENDYQDLSLAMLNRLGYDWDNVSGDWQFAQRIADVANNRGDTGLAPTDLSAGTTYPVPITNPDDAYFNASGLRDDNLARLSWNAELNDTVSVSLTGYSHTDEGQGTWWTPYTNPFSFGATDPNLSPVSVRTTEYDMDRKGGLGLVTLNLGQHKVQGGFWYEDNKFDQYRRFYDNTRSAPRDSLHFLRNPFTTQWGFGYHFETQMFYLSDVWNVTDDLALDAGVKSLSVDQTIKTYLNEFVVPTAASDRNVHGTISTQDSFLPHIGATYRLAENSELFTGYSENIRAYDQQSPNSGRSQAQFEAIRDTTRPESSKTIEAGWRYSTGRFYGVVAAYHVKFDDRLLRISVGPGILEGAPIIHNVGSVTFKGLELQGAYRITESLTASGSFAYNDSTYDNDVVDSTGKLVQATGGKRVVNAPENMVKLDLKYETGSFFGAVSGSYTGERFFSYTNTAKVDAYTTFDLTAGYRFTSNAFDGVELALNVTNLLDKEYVSTLGTNGYNDASDNQTLMVGAPRQVFLAIKKAF
jgi:iron complex outermembrane receptor protein